MSRIHVVQQGESLSIIAHAYGFSDWSRIYYDPSNDDLRRLRPNPHVLFPGDRVCIPDRELRAEDRSTDQRHRFQVTAARLVLRIVVEDGDGEPLRGYAYRLELEQTTHEGVTPASGMIEHPIPGDARTGVLTVWFDETPIGPFRRWPLGIAHLDPVEHLTGVQARLNNLGFDSGPVDGIFGPITKGAVVRFQERHGLRADGIPGPITQGKLKQVYGC